MPQPTQLQLVSIPFNHAGPGHPTPQDYSNSEKALPTDDKTVGARYTVATGSKGFCAPMSAAQAPPQSRSSGLS